MFRAVSMALAGSERHHSLLRRLVVRAYDSDTTVRAGHGPDTWDVHTDEEWKSRQG
jgi:hypothetical protein